jgi:hypothetical protein
VLPCQYWADYITNLSEFEFSTNASVKCDFTHVNISLR